MCGRGGGSRSRFLGVQSHDIDAALEICAIFDDDAGGLDITHQLGILANVQLVHGFHVSLDLPEDHDFAGFHCCLNAAAGADGELIFGELDGAFDVAVDIEILFTEDLTVYFDCLADRGRTSGVRLGDFKGVGGHGYCFLPDFYGILCHRRRLPRGWLRWFFLRLFHIRVRPS